MKADAWKEEELNLLRKIYAKSNKELLLQSFPSRTFGAIKNKANVLKLKKATGFFGRKVWTNVEKNEIKLIYAETHNQVLADKYNCTINSVNRLASLNGLKKSADFLKNMITEKFIEGGKKTRFEAGNVSFNKGKKLEDYLTPEKIEKVKQTQFKKGSKPHNHKPLGDERISKDGYLEIKVNDFSGNQSKKNYQFKHRLLWEEKRGGIPPKTKVSFKPGASKTDFTIDDLYLESHANNLRRNSMSDNSIVKRFLGIKEPEQVEFVKAKLPEIIELKRNQIKLNQKINESCKKD